MTTMHYYSIVAIFSLFLAVGASATATGSHHPCHELHSWAEQCVIANSCSGKCSPWSNNSNDCCHDGHNCPACGETFSQLKQCKGQSSIISDSDDPNCNNYSSCTDCHTQAPSSTPSPLLLLRGGAAAAAAAHSYIDECYLQHEFAVACVQDYDCVTTAAAAGSSSTCHDANSCPTCAPLFDDWTKCRWELGAPLPASCTNFVSCDYCNE
eukprot:CAMPEP_0194238168 /NCGR_PEP_ID=MMETSP0158-20130606/4980_1 /TAXON_ID=33649 /ORGANISM="Thalassionema nitzschioides, Strain L26-B" /LENGTH=209 /DNA_ID=CAMNT_0038972359 /DNA_START=20 /DNA_END=649 /DNA_ORIENTATION=+